VAIANVVKARMIIAWIVRQIRYGQCRLLYLIRIAIFFDKLFAE